tara:strand:+ start:98 stop:619 length:522 start_codon:yes stop_codon:yes gene_type:complete
MRNNKHIQIGFTPTMIKTLERLQDQGFLTSQESIDDAFYESIYDTLKKWQHLADIRNEEPDPYLDSTWEQQRDAALSDVRIHVRYIKEYRENGVELYDSRITHLFNVIEHTKHKYMTYQQWIDYHLEHWTDWKLNGKPGHFYGWTEEKLKARGFPEAHFNAEKMHPCTCAGCK